MRIFYHNWREPARPTEICIRGNVRSIATDNGCVFLDTGKIKTVLG